MKKYQIIYADPPWQYKVWSKKGNGRSAESHYKTMNIEDIINLKDFINAIADDNCVLFIWITYPCLKEALKVIESWGFKYKTCGFTWVKRNKKSNTWFWGMGYWTRANSELCLIATKGNVKRISRKVHQIIDTPIEEHSKKPDIVRDKIVELIGDLPRIELFARKKVDGWDSWGNEVKSDINIEDYKKRRCLNVNWIVGNLQNALDTWNGKLSEIYSLVTQSPADFKGGAIWNIILNINGALQAIGLALLVLFFVVGVVRTCTNFSELKRPEQAVKLFLRFAIAKGIVTYGLDLMLSIFKIIQGIVTTIMAKSSFQASGMSLPQSIIDAIEKCGFFESIPLWAVTLLGGLFVTVLSFILILTVYGRFFKLYMYTAIAPIPLSSFAGEPTQNIGKSFLKSYIAVCLEGAIIVLACVIFSAFVTNSPSVDTGAATVTMVWKYVGELIFNMLVLVGTIRLSDRIIREMMGI